jgi:TonB family protein
MEEKDKHGKPNLPDFLRYRKDNLTPGERNRFERELQKDPFAAEAEEGLSSLDPDQVLRDVENLRGRLRRRTAHPRRMLVYRIAASAAVLMIISTVFVILQRTGSPGGEKKAEREAAEIVIAREEPLVKAEAPTEQGPVSPKPSEGTSESRPSGGNAIAANEVKADVTVKEEEVQQVVVPEKLMAADEAAERKTLKAAQAPAPVVTSGAIEKDRQVKGKVISNEDNLPVPGAFIAIKGTATGTVTDTGGNFSITIPENTKPLLVASYIGMKTTEVNALSDSVLQVRMDPEAMALQEVVVTGYGERRARSNETGAVSKLDLEKQAAYIEYKPAEPVNGMESFNRYIESSMRRPPELSELGKAVVIVSFKVTAKGTVENIRVLRSPGQVYIDEAIRLIREGPSWKPATEDGKPVNEEVKVRIMFK